jgi:molecular chaperone DnaK
VPVGLRVRLGCATPDEFAEKYAVNLARGGFFVRTRDPQPVGTSVMFELLLAGGERVIAGTGVVVWTKVPGPAEKAAPGMGLRFTGLDAPSRALLDRMTSLRERRGLAQGAAEQAAAAESPAPEAPALESPVRPSAAPPSPPRLARAEPPPRAPIPSPPPPTVAAQADLSLPHTVQKLSSGPQELDLGLDREPKPAAHPSRAIIGIDLGTTNSCAAVVKDGKPYVIPSREGHNTVPSIVALNARHRLVVGHLARAQLLSNPKDTVYGAKRLLGRPYSSKAVQQIRAAFAYDVVEGDDGLAAVELGGQRLSLEEVSALILKEVKDVAQNHLGEEVNRAVITVPAYYNERQREAVRRAGALAGLTVERIVNEPTAAALAYAYGRRLRQRILVYDLGGGTFDASILELEDNVYEVVSTGGDTFLGGVDFDNRIVGRLLEIYERQAGQAFDGDRVALSRLVDAAERTKCALSERQEFRIQLPFLAMKDGQPLALDATLTRDDVVRMVRPLVERTLDVCRGVLAAKGLDRSQLDEVILVGGQSRMPLVHEEVRAFFGKTPSRAVHPDEAVALGAALLAHSLGSAEGIVLIDVLPMAIGVTLPDGRVRPVFEKNTPLPSRKQYTLATTHDGQTEFELTVVQGESAVAADCEYLGTVRLDGLPAGPRGMVRIAVTFDLGPECLLTVTARESRTHRVVSASFAPRPRPTHAITEGAARPEGSALVTTTLPLPAPSKPKPPGPRPSGMLGFFRQFFGRDEAR